MGNISRRDFLAMAAVLGAEAAWGRSFSTPSKISWRVAHSSPVLASED